MTTILVVEDTKTDAERVRSALAPYPWTLKFVSNSAEARAAIQEDPPDAIVMDIMLPDDTGFQLCRDIKSKPETQQIPIIICSSKTTDIDRFWALKQGAAFFVPKPINPKVLCQSLRQLVPEPSEAPESPLAPSIAPQLKLLPQAKEIYTYARWQFLAL